MGYIQSVWSQFVRPVIEANRALFLEQGTPISCVHTWDVADAIVGSLRKPYISGSTRYQTVGLGLEWSDVTFLLGDRFWDLAQLIDFVSVFYRKSSVYGGEIALNCISRELVLGFMNVCSLFEFTSVISRSIKSSIYGPFFQVSKKTQNIYLTFSNEFWKT